MSYKQQINEIKRGTLISKSKKSPAYRSKPSKNRWIAKESAKVANTVKDYNKINMNDFWKNDILEFKVRVEGESDNYFVTVVFSNILDRLVSKVKSNRNKLEADIIYKTLFEAINSSDIKIDCSCPDFKYRFRVWATKHGYNAGSAESREAKITNPNDQLGAGCKHVLSVLNNAEWLKKIASVINNYVNYCKDNTEYNYSRFIFPKIYGMSYDKAVQLTINDLDDEGKTKDTLDSDEALINLSNALGKVRGRIKKGSNKNPVSSKEQTDEK